MGKREDTVTISTREMERLKILHRVMERRLTQVKAGELIGVADRHVRRMIQKVREVNQKEVKKDLHRISYAKSRILATQSNNFTLFMSKNKILIIGRYFKGFSQNNRFLNEGKNGKTLHKSSKFLQFIDKNTIRSNPKMFSKRKKSSEIK